MSDQTIVADCKRLINHCQTLILATTNEKDSHSSYAPFVYSDNKFYILVSGLAEHTPNLINAQSNIGCMLIADESLSKRIFARKRVMFKAKPEQISRDSASWSRVMEQFETRFGGIIDLLASLPDFVLFELKPEQVVFVKGFGDAHKIPSHQL